MNAAIIQAAHALILSAPRGTIPAMDLQVRRDVRLFGAPRTEFVGDWSRGYLVEVQDEQLRLFEETHITETIKVAVVDERDSLDMAAGRANFRLELWIDGNPLDAPIVANLSEWTDELEVFAPYALA
jgi:hypothetical protein